MGSPSPTLNQLGDFSNLVAVYAGGGSFYARKNNGRWFAGGNNTYQQLGLGKDGW